MSLSIQTFLERSIAAIKSLQEWHHQYGFHGAINPRTLIVEDQDGQSVCQIFPGGKLNTAQFLSPEQTGRLHLEPDKRTDIYSLGILFYQWLVGRLPFESKDPLDLAYSHVAVNPTAPSEANK